MLGLEEEIKALNIEPKEDMAVIAQSESSEFDDEEEGGQWIT